MIFCDNPFQNNKQFYIYIRLKINEIFHTNFFESAIQTTLTHNIYNGGEKIKIHILRRQ